MLTVDEAVKQLLAHCPRPALNTMTLAVDDSHQHILAETISSTVAVPPQDNSAMDGYAFCAASVLKATELATTQQTAGISLNISQRIAAGQAPKSLQAGTAARIFTGAEIPAGADTVAMQENCMAKDGQVTIDASTVMVGSNIRRRGQDVQQGQSVLHRGTVLRPQELGLLASIGCTTVKVYCPLKVAILSTGDELVAPGTPLKAGQIYNSNRSALAGLLKGWGIAVVDMGLCPDDPQQVEESLIKAAQSAHVVISTGGVSVGEEDYIKAAVQKRGEIDFWKVAIKPGKPIAFGQLHINDNSSTPFVGLPGNPASVFVTALLLLRPLLLSLSGHNNPEVRPFTVPSLFDRKAVSRQEYLRARLSSGGVEIHANQSSGMLSSACWAEGLAVQTIGQSVEKGDLMGFHPFSQLFSL